MKGQEGNVPVMRPLSGVSEFNSLRIYKKFKCYLCRHLRGALYRCGTHFDEIGLKSTLIEHWLATFIMTCKLGLAGRLDQITRTYRVLLLAFVANTRICGKVYY